MKRSHYTRTITGLKEGEEISYENSQQCQLVITSCLCVFSVMEVVTYFVYLKYVSYRVFHNNLPKIFAYCSKIKCPGDSLDLLAAHQIWSI